MCECGGDMVRKRWEKILKDLYENQREGVLEGELMAMCSDRADFYQFRRSMREMGIIREIVKLKNGTNCYYFDWETAKKHYVTRHIFEEEETEGVEKNE